ncbi:hypothetical protein [Paenibacillus radicis (ex Gao et al. 2016)]|uniref:Uncharacterized protein n=1 Tax=Paenibacillus radicis (ex Gao et al. 2016) TaxID=1737354 RepID=A0A917M4W1_9BACL|nr:hypothetical protein [Paenibacillus radicis (ex Gao et al. 2016)]GGG78941.1 hypothetical protein GCM10010918_39920 [Paenibacillus radicis (ex Gao et al. 2016)]
MYFKPIRYLSVLILTTGVLLMIYGLWQYMPKTFSSDTSDYVFMKITVKRVVFPVSGLVFTLLGITLLKFITHVDNELESLRHELRLLTKQTEKSQ